MHKVTSQLAIISIFIYSPKSIFTRIGAWRVLILDRGKLASINHLDLLN